MKRNAHRTPLLLLCWASLGAFNAMGQGPDEMLTRYSRAYREVNGVFLKLNTTITITRDGDRIITQRNVEQEHLVLKTPSGEHDREQVHYSGMVPLARIDGWTMSPARNSYRKVKVTDFVHRDERNDNIFHDDSRAVNFHFPQLAPGAITHLDYDLEYQDPHLISGHFFASYDPVEESTFTIVHDEAIEVRAIPFHVPEGALERKQERKRGRVEETFIMRRVSPLTYERNAPSYRSYAPHIQIIVRDRGPNEGTDLDRLYHWYYEHIRGSSTDQEPMLDSLAQAITTGATTDREKAMRVFAWVQEHITYVAVEDGMNGFRPAPAAAVCNARYGDCKGMANLTYHLLKRVGLDAHLAWVGTREIPYTYAELPSTSSDDHMITALDLDNERLLLDATSSECVFGLPSFYIQGKEVLVSLDSTHYEVMRAPIVPPERNSSVDSVRMRLEGSDLVGEGRVTFSGHMRSHMTSIFRRVEKDRWNDILRGGRMKCNNRYRPEIIRVDGLDDRSRPLVVEYRFRLPDMVGAHANERYVPMVLEFPWRDDHYTDKRTVAAELEFCSDQRYVTVLEPPPGTTSMVAPEGSRSDTTRFGYTCSYRTLPTGELECSTSYRTNDILIPASDLAAWGRMLAICERDLNRSVLITLAP